MHKNNLELYRICRREQLNPKDIRDILNQSHTKISQSTVDRWFSPTSSAHYMEMQGYWLDLLKYRLKDREKK